MELKSFEIFEIQAIETERNVYKQRLNDITNIKCRIQTLLIILLIGMKRN